MKKTSFFAPGRIMSLLLSCMLLLSLFSGLALPVEAASSDKVLPEMSKFFGTDYTQAQLTQYSRLLTCTYDKDEGTAPLDAFLDLLQEDRYQLKLDSVSEEYPDSYSTATVKDYFFHYTGTSSAIKWIKLKDGTKYHVRVSLYTYEEKDYSAIVYYSHPNFLHRDSGVKYEDIRRQNSTVISRPAIPGMDTQKTTGETEPLLTAEVPDLSEYFGNPVQTDRKEDRTEYSFEFTRYPAMGMRTFEKYLESIGARESFCEEYESGNILLEYSGGNGILVSMYWFDSLNSLEVIWYDQVSGEPLQTVTDLKNGQTVKVQEDAAFRIAKKNRVTLLCSYDKGRMETYAWKILSGKDVVSMEKILNNCYVTGKTKGTAEIELTYTFINKSMKKETVTSVYTFIVE